MFKDQMDPFLSRWLGYSHPSVSSSMAKLMREGYRSECCVRCGNGVGYGEATEAGCHACRGKPAVLDGVVRVGGYCGQLADLIRLLKYGGRWEYAAPLGSLLATQLKARIIREHSADRWLVIPMPMPSLRRWYRGLDHAGLIAGAVASHLEVEVMQPLRKRPGPPQVTLSRSLRSRSSMDDYRLVRRGIRGFGGLLPNLQGISVILVDDVLTTGRSMRAAGMLLRRLGPVRIFAGALAVTEYNRTPKSPLSGPVM